ncbi:hypothetical protein ASPVEDRAFT_38113 [Aspergillus versicolor CBS 583.65]|uniref:Uncharacterized protein n=1 Tax=Aspergillus versicolor CBS 583.65 TaxID=1036611 RepID=A0A1L9PAS5_ASPVE|nr:uncharacterized protein ASPVEDRAFT_38113 [Aspergillus versicolor CBS 583.65]OJI98608.1 hypothetical protein ASPVEDRAFT_38113 [Aspergillus versicolor CBS 583.65]
MPGIPSGVSDPARLTGGSGHSPSAALFPHLRRLAPLFHLVRPFLFQISTAVPFSSTLAIVLG